MKLEQTLLWVAWNSFLALLPVALAYTLNRTWRWSQSDGRWKVPMVVFGLAWFAFLPNTCYLLTEWRHFLDVLDSKDVYIRSRHDGVMIIRLMIYTAFYFWYSGLGMLTFALAIRPVASIARARGNNLWLLGVPFFLMLSVGVYLGLIERFNSWNLITHPGDVWRSLVDITGRPTLTALILAFAGFLWLAYFVIDIWIDGLKLRCQDVLFPGKRSVSQ